MDQQDMSVSRDVIYMLLQGCTKNKDLVACRQVHCLMIRHGLDPVAVLRDHLIRLFGMCGSLMEANYMFINAPTPSVYTWNAIISAHMKLGQGEMVLKLYHEMQQKSAKPDKFTFSCIFKACASTRAIRYGRLIHATIVGSGLECDVFIGNTLIDMYGKCDSIEEAREVFDAIPNQDLISWGAMIHGYSMQGLGVLAIELFEKMLQEGIKPNEVILLCTLKACGKIGAIKKGRLLYDQIIRSILNCDVVIGTALVDMFAKCGSVDEARKVFDGLPVQNMISWSAMISGYTNNGHSFLALKLFEEMQQEGIKPHSFIFSSILKACGTIGAIWKGRLIHDQIMRSGLLCDVALGNSLVDMYVEYGCLEDANKVFNDLLNKNLMTWGSMISGYMQHGCGICALELLDAMQQQEVMPNRVMFLCLLKACCKIEQSRFIHGQIIRSGLDSDVKLGSAVADIYTRFGHLEDACALFDKLQHQNVVSWGGIIAGHVQHGHGLVALKLFEKMQEVGIKPDAVTFSCALKACSCLGAIREGREIHEKIIMCGLQSDVILENTLVDMYAKCGSLDEAKRVFDELPSRSVVSYCVMIAGFATKEDGLHALKLYKNMQVEGIWPDNFVFSCILKVCGSIGAVEQGRLIHNEIIWYGIESDEVVANTLVDMYVKCGSLEEWCKIFSWLKDKDVQSWGAMIAGHAQHGYWSFVKKYFDEMQEQDFQTDDAILSSILAACSHSGWLGEAQSYFRWMQENYCIIVAVKHYNCIADLLGRLGLLNEAGDVLQTMPTPPDIVLWTSLLSSCRIYGNIELGRHFFDEAIRFNFNDASGYILMSSIYMDFHVARCLRNMRSQKVCT